MNQRKLIGSLVFAAAGAIAIASWAQRNGIDAMGLKPAIAAEEPRVIEIKAKKPKMRSDTVRLATGVTSIAYRPMFMPWSMDIPVKFLGVGESLEDIVEFDPEEFVEALFSPD